MPAISKSQYENFADDDTVSTAAYPIPDDNNYQIKASIPIIDMSDLMGRCFLIITPEDDQCLRLKIVKVLDFHQDDLNYDPALKEFIFT